MKTIFKIISVLTIASLIVVILYFYRSHSNEQEQKYIFSMDLIRSLKLSVESSMSGKGDDINIEALYIGREKLMEAKNLMNNWKNNKNINIAKTSIKTVQGFDSLILSYDLFVKTLQGNSIDTKSDLALAVAKTKSGREKLFDSILDLISIISSRKEYEIKTEQIKFYLSKEQLKSIVHYVTTNFEKEINEYEEKENLKKQGEIETYKIRREVWAVIILKNFIEIDNSLVE